MPPAAAPNVLTKTAPNCFPTLHIFPCLLTTTVQTLPVARCFQPNYSPGTGDYPGLLITTPAHCRVIKTFIRHQTSDIIPGAGRPCRVLTPVRDVNNKTESLIKHQLIEATL